LVLLLSGGEPLCQLAAVLQRLLAPRPVQMEVLWAAAGMAQQSARSAQSSARQRGMLIGLGCVFLTLFSCKRQNYQRRRRRLGAKMLTIAKRATDTSSGTAEK